jgi:Uncharacterized protein conserved in bacteria (DUF2184)
MNQDLISLRDFGVHFPDGYDFIAKDARLSYRGGEIACDAQPSLLTTPSSGIPAFLGIFTDPKLIEVIFAPLKAVEIVGQETKKGDWVHPTAMFNMVEATGVVSSYGDYSNAGKSDFNQNQIYRQQYYYQTTTKWGQQELEIAALNKLDAAAQKNKSSVNTLNRFQNNTYFYGVSGIENYGLLNDPSLSTPISPSVKGVGGVTWSAGATALEVYNDIVSIFTQIQTQTQGVVTAEDEIVLAMSPVSQVALLKTQTYFTTNVEDMLKKAFPKLRIETAPQYATTSGNLVQMIIPSYDGQRTAECAFSDKMRAFPVITNLSSWEQKKAQGTWGCIIYQPMMIASMLGV